MILPFYWFGEHQCWKQPFQEYAFLPLHNGRSKHTSVGIREPLIRAVSARKGKLSP